MMRLIFVSLLRFLAFFYAVCGSLSSSVSSETSVSDQILERLNVSSNSSTNTLLPLTSKHDTALVAAPDGTLYLLEINSRKILWSFTSGPSIYSLYQTLFNRADDKHNASRLNNNFFIDCGEDWELYVHTSDFKKVKLPLSAEEFLRRTPYISADGGVMLGSKKTTVFLVDAKSGTIIHSFRPDDFPSIEGQTADENPIIPKKDVEEWFESRAVDLEAVDQLLYIMRTDYVLKYTSSKTGKVFWYLTFANFEASIQCQGIENSSGRVSSSQRDNFGSEYMGDSRLPLHCQRRPVVYRIRDHSSLESFFVPDRLPNLLPGDTMLSLPASDLISILEPVEELLGPHQNDKGKIVLALPPPETEEFRMVDLHEGGRGELNIGVAPEILARSHLWYSILFIALVFILVCLFYLRYLVAGKQSKFDKKSANLKVQAVMSKKKKSRKSGTNKNSATAEKRQKNVSCEDSVGETSGLEHIERTEKSFLLNFPDHFNGIVGGRKIGRLFVSNREIAKGSNGTVVLEGIYDGRPVAVKRLVQIYHDVALKEIQNLITSDQHPNIVRWYGVEHDQDFVYISLERCTCSLYELISSYSSSSQMSSQLITKDQDRSSLNDYAIRSHQVIANDEDFELRKANGYPSCQLLKLMRDMVYGLAHLHELGIIHRDLKPQNVLILKERSTCAKLSDMGISKRLADGMSSLTKQATGFGSSGWQAPEQLLNERQTRAVDLFCLGCILFFCITGGKHPFGDSLERDINIVNNRKDLFLIENIPEALDLISCLLDAKPELRPKAVEVLYHPFFWNSEMRLSFLRDASDRVELEDRENDSELLKALESIGTVALGCKWDEKMESAFINDIGRYRRYKFDSVRDLLRVIRNKLNHYRELPKEIQGILGLIPEGFESYFSSRFPKFLIEVYKVLHRYCREEEFMRKYFKGNQT